jgi:3-oxoacyl-[acyl-carrier protein] reductase
MNHLTGRAAIVTGGGRGIGRGHCLALAAAGARVVVNDIDADAAEAVVREIAEAGGSAIASTANIASRAGAEDLIAASVAAFGGLDILVNNAGNLRDRSFLKMSDEEFDQVWTVHVKGTFWCTQIAAARMRDQGRGGAIVNTTSGAHFGSFGQTNYAAAKGAIASMTYTWALELARYGIRVNAIGPTGTTRMSETFAGGTPLPYVDPTRNGALVVFLASDAARQVSGQIFGSGGTRVAHMVQPHYGKTLYREDGWTVEALEAVFLQQFAGEFGALGMLGQPYPFHDGVGPGERAVESAA